MLEIKEETLYKFRFEPSNKLIQLTKQELARIPLLFAFVERKNDFPSIQNDQDEYLLHYPIHYNWFMPILHSINTEQPYILFTDLFKDENILDVLQLFDYLCINLFSPPLLDERNIRLLNPTTNKNENQRLVYRRANNLSEARNIAAAFVLSLTKNEYDLNDFKTIECIFSLISVIFSHRDIFSSQFRYHTYTILEEYVFPLFFKEHPIHLLVNIEQNENTDSEIYLYDDMQCLPINFQGAFSRKGIYELREKKVIIVGKRMKLGKSALINMLIEYDDIEYTKKYLYDTIEDYLFPTYVLPVSIELSEVDLTTKELHLNETQSTRPKPFNRLSKIDKFKPRYGPKVQKYR
ncbi:unnamed protein product [Adineta steineri]|uniref:Uncharacterized protein n=1 Tax=Adineta steineri TaxID=433720 RepID=A0A815I6R4_9BILA|nr:unnamed protein product [Adineta steineri]CAF4009388.1 unnamed protein product [Adineta steineri]